MVFGGVQKGMLKKLFKNGCGGPTTYALENVFNLCFNCFFKHTCLNPPKSLKYKSPNIIKLAPVGGHGPFKLTHAFAEEHLAKCWQLGAQQVLAQPASANHVVATGALIKGCHKYVVFCYLTCR